MGLTKAISLCWGALEDGAVALDKSPKPCRVSARHTPDIVMDLAELGERAITRALERIPDCFHIDGVGAASRRLLVELVGLQRLIAPRGSGHVRKHGGNLAHRGKFGRERVGLSGMRGRIA
jgi:hypothetical protein